MATRAIFTIIANDGKADKLIMATQLLNQRIEDIMCARQKAGMSDVNPKLVDIERTHILFTNAHFKPYAAIGFEYSKVRPQSGNSVLGSGVTFSLPQFGDFFHDMVVRVQLSQASTTTYTAPTQAGAGVGGAYPADGEDDVNGAASLAGSTYRLVDGSGALVADGATAQNLVRYCEYPGERLFSKISFEVNNNPLDEYDSEVQAMCRKFEIGDEKLVGYKRLVGQEVARDGYTALSYSTVSDSDANGTAAQLASAVPVIANSGNGRTGNIDISRQKVAVCNGPQTPKVVQPALDLWVPLKFWFNKDVRLAVPSVSIPFGQRFITMEMVTQDLLAFEAPNLFVEASLTTLPTAALNPGSAYLTNAAAPQAAVADTTIVLDPYGSVAGTGTIQEIKIQRMELYVNNIFMNPEIHDIYIKRIGFSLIRVYRRHKNRVNQADNDEQLLNQLKWPIEYMYICLKPAYNVSANNPTQWRDWHRCTRILDANASSIAGGAASVEDFGAGAVNYEIPLKTVETLSVTAHEITIFDAYPDEFFNAYQPLHFGGHNIRPPVDEGALFLNFALLPGIYQPSGHFNLSRAREFYVRWTTVYVDSSTPADLKAVAIAINFVLYTDGTAVLRYST